MSNDRGVVMTEFTRTDEDFRSSGLRCAAWLYRPAGSALANDAGLPCVVMAHGLGGVRTAGLEPYAEAFAAAGLAVLLFDYRYFGDSEGQPREQVVVAEQHADWHAAIAHARSLPGIDAARIGIWGSSFSGGHVLAVAASDQNVAAVCSQGAMMDGLGALKHLTASQGMGHTLRLTAAALRDAVQRRLGGARVYLPVVGAPGDLAVLATEDAKAGYLRIAPSDWPNRMTTEMLLTLAAYRPGLQADQVACPILFVVATTDSICPPADVEAAARRAGDKATVLRLDTGHFEIYVDKWFAQGCGAQTAFLTEHLAP